MDPVIGENTSPASGSPRGNCFWHPDGSAFCQLRRSWYARCGTACLLTAVVVGLLPAAGACRKDSASGPERAGPSGDGFIAVVGAGRNDEMWHVLRASALRTSRDFGGMAVRTFAPQDTSQSDQIELIEDLRGPELRALCVQVMDPEAILSLLEDLRTSGVLVVTMVRAVPSPFPFHHCGIHEPEVGKAIGEALAEGLGRKGTIAVLRSDETDRRLAARYRGFRDEIERHTEITILRELRCDGDPMHAQQLIRDFCERFPRLQGFAVLENWPFRPPHGLSQPLVPGECILVSADPLPCTWATLSKGWCYAMVAAEYDRIAYRAVQWCLLAGERKEVPVQTHSVGVRKVWVGNLDSFKAQWLRWMEAPTPKPQ